MEVPEEPTLVVSPTNMFFGATTTQESIDIMNTGTGNLTWSFSESINWLYFSSSSGSITTETDQVITGTVDRNSLSPGSYNGTFTIVSNGGNQDITVTIVKLAEEMTGTFVDSRDNKIYKTVKIGDQWWMAENLAFNAGSGCWAYGNNENNVAIYGRLYTWDTALKSCPSGWHLPSNDEWKQLEMTIGMSQSEASDLYARGKVGSKLKSPIGWIINMVGTDDYGFYGLPGGMHDTDGSFNDIGERIYWWTSSQESSSGAWYRRLAYSTSYIYLYPGKKAYGFSVRCIKD